MTTAIDILTSTELSTLAQCERTIEAGLKTLHLFAEALRTIRDQRLYRAEYATFEHYCRERWSISKTHCNRLIQASEVAANVAPIGVKPTESQARELSRVPADQQPAIWQEVVERTEGRPTAAAVRSAVEARRDEPQVTCWDEQAEAVAVADEDDTDVDEEDETAEIDHIGNLQQALREIFDIFVDECPDLRGTLPAITARIAEEYVK